MNPVSLAILIVKVALCTLPFIAGLRLLFLSKEAFVSFTGRLFGIADLEISHSTYITVKVIGALLVAGALGLACLFFWPEPDPAAQTRTAASIFNRPHALPQPDSLICG